jgi:hypothetical protein
MLFAIWNFSPKLNSFLFDQTGWLRPKVMLKNNISWLFFQPGAEKDSAARNKKASRPISATRPRHVGIERKKDRL